MDGQTGFDEEMLADRMTPQDGQPVRIRQLINEILGKIKPLPVDQAVVEAMAVDTVIGYKLISECYGQKLADEALIKKIQEIHQRRGILAPTETIENILSETRRLGQLILR